MSQDTTPSHKAWGCDCAVCREWRRRIWASGHWPRPRDYNGERKPDRPEAAPARPEKPFFHDGCPQCDGGKDGA